MKNENYIKENKLEKQYKIFVDEKIDYAYNKLKKECTINMKPALTKNEKILFTCSNNFHITLEAIRAARELKKLPQEEAVAEQRKKIKKIVNTLDKEHNEHLEAIRLVNQIEDAIRIGRGKKTLFNKFIKRPDEESELDYDKAIALQEAFIKQHGGKDLQESLKIYLYGEDYDDKKWCMDSEVYSISQDEKEIQYAVLNYITGESLDYATKMLENNFVNEYKRTHNK